jgi:epoxyqueuosine reductase
VNGDSSPGSLPVDVKFAQKRREPAFAARAFLRREEARTVARDLLAFSDERFDTAFDSSPMKRAKLRVLKREAAVVLGNIAATDDIDVVTHSLDEPDPLVCVHAGWAIARLSAH